MGSFRVMSYNIRFDCPTDGPFRWQHRSSMVASMLQFHHGKCVLDVVFVCLVTFFNTLI